MLILSILISLLLLIILPIASFYDIKTRRIPNNLSVLLVIASITIYLMIGELQGLLFSLKGMGLGFIILFIPYLFGVMGAGDVKLMTGVGAALGPWQVLQALLFTSLLGGVLAMAIIFAGKNFRETIRNFYACVWMIFSGAGGTTLKSGLEHNKKTKVPYGVVIACGTFTSMLWQVMVEGKLPVGNF